MLVFQMRNVDKTLLYFVYADKSATPLVFTGIVALF